MKSRISSIVAGAIGLLGLLSIAAAQPPVTLAPGDSVIVRCTGSQLSITRQGNTQVVLNCQGATPTKTPNATATKTLAPSATPTRTSPPSATPTASPPTATPGSGLDPVDAEILGTCSAAVHDRFVVAGPDGRPYRTWHPVTVPVDPAQPGGATCTFAHEHGQDPVTSIANPALPPFGYIGAVALHPPEAHQGFKVFVANAGTVNDEGRRATHSTRLVLHMGTGGVARYTMPHHSMMFDMVAGDGSGRYIHVQGMADTKKAGSICERDAGLGIGRTVVTLPGTGCDVESLYEIWEFTLGVGGKATALASAAVFDPITVMDPSDQTRLIYTNDVFGGDPHGCNAEAYHGPIYWYNKGGAAVFYTDAFGAPGSSLRQEVSAHSTDFSKSPAYNATNDGLTQFKLHKSQCVTGLGLKN